MPPNKVRPPAGHRRAEGDGFNVNLILPPAAAESGPLHALLEETSHESCGPLSAITVLARQTAPFRFDTPAGHSEGGWLARATADLGDHTIHLRRLQCLIIGETKPDGSRYTNTDKGWMWLESKAAAVARWLGYMTFTQMPILVARRFQAVIRYGGQADWRHGVKTFADLDDVAPRRSEIACDWGSLAALADKLMVVGTMTGAEVVDVFFKAKCGRRLVAR